MGERSMDWLPPVHTRTRGFCALTERNCIRNLSVTGRRFSQLSHTSEGSLAILLWLYSVRSYLNNKNTYIYIVISITFWEDVQEIFDMSIVYN